MYLHYKVKMVKKKHIIYNNSLLKIYSWKIEGEKGSKATGKKKDKGVIHINAYCCSS